MPERPTEQLASGENLGVLKYCLTCVVNVPEVASITGHQTPTMLLRYAHADVQRLRRKLSAVTSGGSWRQQLFQMHLVVQKEKVSNQLNLMHLLIMQLKVVQLQ